MPAFATATIIVFVEHNGDIACDAGLSVKVRIDSSDGLSADFEQRFGCTTGFWPL